MLARQIEVRQVGLPVLRLILSEPLELGRDCDGLLLRDVKTSRRHARLTPRRNGVVVEDLGSSNGTWVNDQRIVEATLITSADVVLVGDTEIAVRRSTDVPLAPPPDLTRPLDPGSSIAQLVHSLSPADLAPPLAKRFDGTVTILFSDIENSTDLQNRFGDRAWLQLLREHNAMIRKAIRAHGGTEVKTMGDGFMVTFRSAAAGLDSAIDVQRSMADRAVGGGWPIRVRLGLHSGEVLRSGDDVFGSHVNVAARVAAQATGDQILVSGLLHDLVRPVTDVRFAAPREMELKGFDGTYRVHAVLWRDGDDTPASTAGP
jgi:class 3 adenylate cyclase